MCSRPLLIINLKRRKKLEGRHTLSTFCGLKYGKLFRRVSIFASAIAYKKRASSTRLNVISYYILGRSIEMMIERETTFLERQVIKWLLSTTHLMNMESIWMATRVGGGKLHWRSRCMKFYWKLEAEYCMGGNYNLVILCECTYEDFSSREREV